MSVGDIIICFTYSQELFYERTIFAPNEALSLLKPLVSGCINVFHYLVLFGLDYFSRGMRAIIIIIYFFLHVSSLRNPPPPTENNKITTGIFFRIFYEPTCLRHVSVP